MASFSCRRDGGLTLRRVWLFDWAFRLSSARSRSTDDFLPGALLLLGLAEPWSFFFSGDDVADDERLLDDDEFEDDDEVERLDADEELVEPDELEPLELERDARLRFIFDGDSRAFLTVSVSTVILTKRIQIISFKMNGIFLVTFSIDWNENNYLKR